MIWTLIASIFSIPYMVGFIMIWVVASLIRPVLVASTVAFWSQPSAALRKLELMVNTVRYLALCKEKKWKPTPDPALIFDKYRNSSNETEYTDGKNNKPNKDGVEIEQKTIIFLRHGESSWNDTFNKGDRKLSAFIQGFIPGLLQAIATEWYFAVTGQAQESWFYDAPLSEKGRVQAERVREFVFGSQTEFLLPKEREYVNILKGAMFGDEVNSQLVSSPLRRAAATMAIGLQDRFVGNNKTAMTSTTTDNSDSKMVLLPALQEISFNPDALCITPPHGKLQPAWTDPPVVQSIYEQSTDSRLYTGNKPVNGKGIDRLQDFCHLVFTEFESKDAIIAAGHSLWFRSFFRTYLPHSSSHVSKTKKLVNGGLVAFTLQRLKEPDSDNGNATKEDKSKYHYMIDPTSITVLHGGF